MDKNSDIVLIVNADNILEEDTLGKIARCFRELEEKELSTYVIQGYPKSIVMYTGNKNRLSSSSIIQFDQNEVNKNKINYNNNNNNWISRGVSFRLYQRNLVEFIAKEKLNLPLQITGSLFAIRTIILKAIKFSNDICEDWDLTLDIYLSEVANNLLVSVENKFAEYKKTRKINYDKINNNSNKTKHNGKIQKIISF